MPLLGPDSPLPCLPRRVLVAGPSGSGKTTTAGLVAAALRVPHHELDALFHGPNWTPRPEFEADVRRFAAAPGWVTEWQYEPVRPLLLDRADLVIWLDLPRHRVMRQVVARTVRRRIHREVLWNGNVEPPFRAIFTERDYVVRWAWVSHHKTAARMARIGTERPELTIVRLRTRNDVRTFARSLERLNDPSPRS